MIHERKQFIYMRNLLKVVIFSTALFLAAGCARKSTQQHFFGLVKLTNEKATYLSEEYRVSFHDAVFYNEEIAVDVKIENLSDEIIEVNPTNWSYLITFRNDSFRDSELDYIIDPVERLENLREIQQFNKNKWWARPIGGLLKFSAAALTANYLEMDETMSDGLRDVISSPAEAGKSIKEGKEVDFWETAILKPSTLKPGESLSGLIFFAYDYNAISYEVFLNLNDKRTIHKIQQDNG